MHSELISYITSPTVFGMSILSIFAFYNIFVLYLFSKIINRNHDLRMENEDLKFRMRLVKVGLDFLSSQIDKSEVK